MGDFKQAAIHSYGQAVSAYKAQLGSNPLRTIAATSLAAAALGGILTYASLNERAEYSVNIATNGNSYDEWRTCNPKKTHRIVEGDSMTPMIKNGARLAFLEEFYKECGILPGKGDIVAYRYGWETLPLIKVVRATAQDTLAFQGDQLTVNGKTLENSTGEAYHFTSGEIKLLSLYMTNGRLPTNSYFVFGDNVKVSTDSRKFGAISASDLLGKFVTE